MSNIHTFSKNNSYSIPQLLPLIFILGRFLLYLALMPNDLRGLGDFANYFDFVSLPGIPFFDYWTEYPPLFSLSIEFINIISANNQFVFDFLLYFLISISGALCIWLFSKIACKVGISKNSVNILSIIYFTLLAFISFSWWYFDLVVVFFMLLSIYFLLGENDTKAGVVLGLGVLLKWFPILLLPAVFKFKKLKPFLKITAISIGITILIWIILFFLSPDMTTASIISQPSRSSWQTAWALIDGNFSTGAYIPLYSRLDPSQAAVNYGNPAKIPPWLTLLIFSGLGIFFLGKLKNYSNRSLLSILGITWVLFLIWSPGWSPQWILYIIPFILLSLPINKGLLLTFLLSMLALLEWPLLLGRQLFQTLWFIIPLRMVIFIVLLALWYEIISKQRDVTFQ